MANEDKLKEHILSHAVDSANETNNKILFDDLKDVVSRALEQLTPRQREVFNMSRDLQMSHKEIAEALGIFAKENGADFTEPITAGIFVSIAAWASHQRLEDKTPYWRTLKANGELNEKYPGGTRKQIEKLEAEGHIIIQKGRKSIRYYVKDYEDFLFEMD